MTNPSTPPPGQLGRYRILRRLGAGGMAEVFLAKSAGAENIEKLLVVKRVLPTFARSPKFVSMFVDEAKLAMRLNHPNIVQVYAFEQVKDEFLLAMEYVDGLDLGRTLSAARRRGLRVPYALAAYLVMEIAKGLDYAHNRKDETGSPMEIVHRDVSPQNVLLSYDGAVKVADFGIARARMISEETGVIKGKFSYMSPEQARGQRVDRRSDVFSLGVLFAELLMNRTMYPGLQGMEILEEVRDGRVTRPRDQDLQIPEPLDAIAQKAMAFDREQRFQSCREMATALTKWLHAQDELHDGHELETFLSEVAPREVTHPEVVAQRDADGQNATMLSMANAQAQMREMRERRNVVVVAGRVRAVEGDAVDPEADEVTPEQARRVLDDIAFKYDAIIDWSEEDGVVVFRYVLGLARTSADDPLHATRLALDVIEALEGLSSDARRPLKASIGLSRGVVVTVRGGKERARFEPVGNVFDVARRLAAAAKHDEVLASGEVFRLARRAFAFDEDETRDVTVPGEGQQLSLRAYHLRGARTRDERAKESASLASQVGLVGRANEIQALAQTYEEVVQSQKSSYLAVVGEIGVGKTALVGAALGRFRPDPVFVHVECAFGAADVPYSLVTDIVREVCSIGDNDTPEQAQKKLRDAVRRSSRTNDRRESALDAFEPLVVPGTKPDDGGDRTQRLLSALRELLTAIASKSPAVLWIDSVQFADAPSCELLARLMLQTLDSPLFVIISARPESRLEPVLRGLLRIDLEELAEEDRRALVEAHLGGAHVPPDVLNAIVHRAGGNPFFLKELLDALLERGLLRFEEGPERRVVRRVGGAFALPSTLEDVIAARIAELSDGERLTLRWLSVVGAGLRPVEVSELTGIEVSDALRVLEDKGLLQRRAGGALAFPSAIVRHVAYESLEAQDRARMHKRVAQFLSTMQQRPPPARIARHLELAGERLFAARAYRDAGHAARNVHSNRDALRFYARTLDLLPETSPERFELYELRENMYRNLSLRAEQRGELEAMRALAEHLRDPKLLAIAYNRLARCDLDLARTVGVEAVLRKALDAALAGNDRRSEIEALRLFGHLRRDQGDSVGALEMLDRALLRAGNDPDLLAVRGLVLANRANLLWRTGALDRSIESSAESIAIFRRMNQKSLQAHALNTLGVALASQGDFEDAIHCIRASVVLDRECGDRIHVGRKVSNIGQLYAELGDTENAVEYLERALLVFERADDPSARTDTLSALAELLVEQAPDLERAMGVLDQARVSAERVGDNADLAHERIVRSIYLEARGELAAAEEAAREAVTHARAAGTLGYELLASAMYAVGLSRAGKFDAALRVATEVETQAAARGAFERAERVYMKLAETLFLAGRPERARPALAAAVQALEARLERIRDPRLRTRFQDGPISQAVRSMVSRHAAP